MGCSSSKQANLMDVAPAQPHNTGHGGHTQELSADDLRFGLDLMANYIAKKGRNIQVVVVGGAVSTLFLGSRRTTPDIDFLYSQISAKDISLLRKASEYARRQPHMPPLEEEWINNRTIHFIPASQRDQLVTEARQQGSIVYQRPGLTLLAAPWRYQFAAKLHRISGGGGKAHDPADAAGYLQQYLQIAGRNTVTVNEVHAWCQQYRVGTVTQSGLGSAVRSINHAYASRFGGAPII